eukprot:GGOE01033311.1.p1 GENE.GGOE01033311.1~~GGOE01033311.1.p1  ORF type:complete len:1167 (-),score=340.26 GGOE01033311.1:555-3878(-)
METYLASLPRRPVSSSWQDRTSDGRSTTTTTTTTSDIVKLQHTTIEMADFEGSQGKGGQEEVVGVTRQLTRTTEAEKLYDVFHQLYPDGHAPLVVLPEMFSSAGLRALEEEVEAALRKVCPEVNLADNIPFPQCQEVFLHLLLQRSNSETPSQQLASVGCIACWMATDKGAINLLLLIVVTLCGASALLAAGIAIVLLFMDGVDNADNDLQDDLGLVNDIIGVFVSQVAVGLDNEEASTLAASLSTVLEYVGYISAVEMGEANLLKVATATSHTIAAWLSVGPEKPFISFTTLVAVLANTTLSMHGLNETAALFDELGRGMPADYEVALARWQNSTAASVEYLTRFRFAAQCPNGVCITNATVTAPMAEALSGNTFAEFGMDYLGTTAFAGFTSRNGLGVEVMFSQSTLMTKRFNLVSNIIKGWNSDSTNDYELLVANRTALGVGCLLVSPNNCSEACKKQVMSSGSPMNRALQGQTGVIQFTNHRGVKAMAAYMPVGDLPMGLVVQLPISQITATSVTAITSLLSSLNTEYALGSQEFELSTFRVQGSNATITHLTPYRYGGDCPSGQCVETSYVREAVKDCSTGVARTTDYRNVSVLVGYSCISSLNVVVSYKVDLDDIEDDNFQAIVDALNVRTTVDTTTRDQFLLGKPKAGLTASDVKGYDDFEVKNNVKFPKACVNANCTWHSEATLRAFQGKTDVIDSVDYRNVAMKAAGMLSTVFSFGGGLSLAYDSEKVLRPIVDTTIQIACFAIGMVVSSTAVLILITKLFLKSMITAQEEGQKVVQTEKDRFGKLVSSMYPAYVVPQLLEGEKQMVCEVPKAAVFFSDIHEFTSASNSMGSKELLLLMGYVYGVMDNIAGRLGVYKVKTIGDAYLAVLGLPGTTSANVSLDLLRFASCVCQVFGDRFVHPTEGQVLEQMNNAMSWNGRAAQAKHMSVISSCNASAKGGRSTAPSSTVHSQPSREGSKASADGSEASRGHSATRVQCIMSYGLAFGKLVAGVLAGRSPMFDIWGNTVNLASRMQSTGEPGRIQVSEYLYQKVVAEPGQPFTFDSPHSVYCKGFGNVSAYMVRTTAEGLPKDLQAELRVEPRYGEFFFDNVLPCPVSQK